MKNRSIVPCWILILLYYALVIIATHNANADTFSRRCCGRRSSNIIMTKSVVKSLVDPYSKNQYYSRNVPTCCFISLSSLQHRDSKTSHGSIIYKALPPSSNIQTTASLLLGHSYNKNKSNPVRISQTYHNICSQQKHAISFIPTNPLPSINIVTRTIFLSSAVAFNKNIITNINTKTMTKTLFLLSFILITFASIWDIRQTKKRQHIDATSEWGRYADKPSARSRALFALMGKMFGFVCLARMVNMLPGGEYTLFKKRIQMNGNKDASAVSANNQLDDISTKKAKDSWASQKAMKIRTHSGQRFAEGLLRLGPLYIKIGQIISCREKLLPEEWKVALERLQDRVPAKSGKDAFDLAYQAYDGNATKFHSIFSEFDDIPLAAASLGQVHRATLRSNNATVAIKLQRSRLRDIYDKDLALMNKIAKGVDTFAGKIGQVGGVKQSWESIFKDAESILYREIDYRDEANNAIRFSSDFGIGKDGQAIECTAKSLDGKVLPSAAGWMRTPFVYNEYSTEKILVMEYVPSIKITDDKKLSSHGISKKNREYLAECLARAYLRQFCVNKFFSTDPHPGNLGVEILRGDQTEPPVLRLVFYDFGQACALKDDQSGGILDVIEGIVDTNVDNCVNAFTRMGVLVDGADLDKVKTKVKQNFETGLIKVKSKKRGQTNVSATVVTEAKLNSTEVKITSSGGENIEKVNDAEIMSFFTLPAEYAFVARAISQMDGVGKFLDEDFDFISACAPYLVEIKGGERYMKDEIRKILISVLNWEIDLQKKLGFDPKVKIDKLQSKDS